MLSLNPWNHIGTNAYVFIHKVMEFFSSSITEECCMIMTLILISVNFYSLILKQNLRQHWPDDPRPNLNHTSEHDRHTYPDLRSSWGTKAPQQDLKNVFWQCYTKCIQNFPCSTHLSNEEIKQYRLQESRTYQVSPWLWCLFVCAAAERYLLEFLDHCHNPPVLPTLSYAAGTYVTRYAKASPDCPVYNEYKCHLAHFKFKWNIFCLNIIYTKYIYTLIYVINIFEDIPGL